MTPPRCLQCVTRAYYHISSASLMRCARDTFAKKKKKQFILLIIFNQLVEKFCFFFQFFIEIKLKNLFSQRDSRNKLQLIDI